MNEKRLYVHGKNETGTRIMEFAVQRPGDMSGLRQREDQAFIYPHEYGRRIHESLQKML
ncbi:hypothetical protein CM49_00862 [Paenibacillus sp. P1XP2]|nr:hypothetical protein CM49_00862 [Paenibacillus sp. P1XP2]